MRTDIQDCYTSNLESQNIIQQLLTIVLLNRTLISAIDYQYRRRQWPHIISLSAGGYRTNCNNTTVNKSILLSYAWVDRNCHQILTYLPLF